MIMVPIEMPRRCAECYFTASPEEFGVPGKPGYYEKISKCLLAPEEVEDPWRSLLWQLENKESWCPLKEYREESNAERNSD